MRVSTREDDRGYHTWRSDCARWLNASILLDGNHVSRVVTFDTEEGYILRPKTDEHGGVVIQGDEIVFEELRGIVSIIEPTE